MRPSSLRTLVEARAKGRCEYCKAPERACGYRFHLEHILPQTLGGVNNETNLALACASCNLSKSNRISALDSSTGVETNLFNPRKQEWEDHFQRERSSCTLTPLTSMGRVTIECLDLNNPMRLTAREYWFTAGLLPTE